MKENMMAVKPVNKLMLGMGIPFIISMIMQGLYNIVDSAFVANMEEYGEEGVNALTLAAPIQILFIACAIGTGIGANAFVSRYLGAKEPEKASKTAGNCLFMGIIIYAVFVLFALFGAEPYIRSQTSNPIIYEMAVEYLQICCLISVGNIYFGLFEKLLQATGHPLCSTISQITGAVINIILDPIMIYGLLGVPQMGVRGAAIATVIGQIVSGIMGMVFYIIYTKELDKKFKNFIPNLQVIKNIYRIGGPAILMQAMAAVMGYGLNLIFVTIGEAFVTAYGIFYRIQQIIMFAIFGLRDAITPIVAFSFGAKNKERLKDGVKYGLIYTIIIALIGTAIVEIFAGPLARVFGLSGETESLCIMSMRIVGISFVFAGVNIAIQGVFQALGGGKQSLIITLLRQLILVLPVGYGFAQIVISDSSLTWLIWVTFIIAEVVTCVVAFLMYRKMRKNVIETIN